MTYTLRWVPGKGGIIFSMAEQKIVNSTCGMCFAACGMLIQVEDGKVTGVKRDPESPVNYGILCPKGRAAIELLYHSERLTHPLKQIGEKGRGEWTRVYKVGNN